jgi:hypothetical protein
MLIAYPKVSPHSLISKSEPAFNDYKSTGTVSIQSNKFFSRTHATLWSTRMILLTGYGKYRTIEKKAKVGGAARSPAKPPYYHDIAPCVCQLKEAVGRRMLLLKYNCVCFESGYQRALYLKYSIPGKGSSTSILPTFPSQAFTPTPPPPPRVYVYVLFSGQVEGVDSLLGYFNF